MVSNNNVLHIFSNIVFTKGANRTFVLDMQHSKFYFVPNSMCEFIKEYNHKTFDEIFSDFSADEYNIVADYLDFLQSNLIGAFLPSECVGNFLDFSLKYQSPYLFENAVIDIDNDFDITIIEYLDKVAIPYIQIRFLDRVNSQLLNILEDLSFVSVQIVVKNIEFREKILQKYPKISSVFVYECPQKRVRKCYEKNVYYRTNSNFECKGKISKKTFSVNAAHVCLSKNCNSCLYKKISIDKNGEIKNCPSMKRSYGNIATTELKELLNNPEFTKLWYITKDKVEVCKDCEFRNICTDCRCFLTDETNIFSKPKNCSYDPYTNKW